jgi:hypothetical protein
VNIPRRSTASRIRISRHSISGGLGLLLGATPAWRPSCCNVLERRERLRSPRPPPAAILMAGAENPLLVGGGRAVCAAIAITGGGRARTAVDLDRIVPPVAACPPRRHWSRWSRPRKPRC